MMQFRRCMVLLFLVLGSMALPVGAQDAEAPTVLDFSLTTDEAYLIVPMGASASTDLVLSDLSRDGPGFLGEATGNVDGVLLHTTSFQIVADSIPTGWSIQQPPGRTTRSGETVSTHLDVGVTPAASVEYVAFNVTATMRANGEEVTRNIQVVARTPGLQVFNAQVPRSLQLAPKQISSIEVLVSNVGVYPRQFDIKINDNPCNMQVSTPASFVIQGHSTVSVFMDVVGPESKLYYSSINCGIRFSIVPTDNPSQAQEYIASATVNGVHVPVEWFITLAWILIITGILVWLVLARKRRIEEAILGKPQPPWTIPAEALYLQRLQEKDPRAAYVVRHFLMEDEYQSSLAWYHAYKRATKGQRSKERLVVAQETKQERWEKAQQRKIARPMKKADRYAIKLQKKLDRTLRAEHRKDRRTWRKACKKLDKKNDKVHEKLTAAWLKQSSRARRKGLEAPEEPVKATPDYPEEPVLATMDLADHKSARKALRFQERMERRTARLQAKYEKEDAKRLEKVRRKVQKIARKLDDPAFIEEHPLLRTQA